MSVQLHLGKCEEVLPTLAENSVDTCITDPPYHLKSIVKRFGKEGSAPAKFGQDGRYSRVSKGFMGKEWDGGDIAFRTETWAAVLRVMKPGAMLLAFGGTRTYHRMAVAIEDAGLEIRDCIFWLYGSGFPKSHNLKIDGWDGWGTALKPACEPIVVAMKPLEGTFAQNAEKWGVAGLNIDGGRIATEDKYVINTFDNGAKPFGDAVGEPYTSRQETKGRWPANVALDEDAAQVLDEQSGHLQSGKPSGVKRAANKIFGQYGLGKPVTGIGDSGGASRFFYVAKASRRERDEGLDDLPERQRYADFGLAQRVEDGVATNERSNASNGTVRNNHPTVKPLSLMRYLCKLTATPTGGIVLDPFMGSGTTGMAAVMEGRDFVGIEREAEYMEIAEKRIAEAQLQVRMPL